MKKLIATAALLLAANATAVTVKEIKSNPRLDTDAPTVKFKKKGQTFRVSVLNTCVDGDKLKAKVTYCSDYETTYVAGRGNVYTGKCAKRRTSTVSKDLVSEKAVCTKWKNERVTDYVVGHKSPFKQTCVSKELKVSEIALDYELKVYSYKNGRYYSNGAPKKPVFLGTVDFTVPTCN